MFFVFFLEEFVNLKVTQLLIGNTVWFIQSEVVSLSNSLPIENFLDWSKSKESADRKMNVSNKNEICFGKGGKHCGKRKKNAGYQHFLLFPQCFQNTTFTRSLKVRIVWKRVKCRKI